MRLAIVLGILVVIAPLVVYSLRLSYSVKTDREFFKGIHSLSAKELFDTLAASWLMLGNVFLACLLFGKYYGVQNWWLVATWLLAFILMMRHVGPVAVVLTSHETLHSFLFARFGSRPMRILAACITAITGIGIIALEIIVVMALLVPVAGGGSPWLPFIAGLAILLTLALYSVLGGFTAVTSTDTYQLIGVFIGLVSLGFVILRAVGSGIAPSGAFGLAMTPTFASTGTSPYWFYAGLFFLQVPLFLGDFGTWQRIKACSIDTVPDQRRTFGRLGIANGIAWVILVVAGIVLAAIPAGSIPGYPNSYLYAVAGPIVDLVTLSYLPGQLGGEALGGALVLCLVVGLVCAMMSTADSYLLIAIQAVYDDILPSKPGKKQDGAAGIRFSRGFSIVAVLIAFAIAVAVVLKEANFLPIISLFFSLQASLSPLTLLALYHPESRRFAKTALWALIVTSLFCIAYGFWAVFSPNATGFHQVNVTFILPVIAFVVPSLVLAAHVGVSDGVSQAAGWLATFVRPKTEASSEGTS